jgi:CubicO group peptidase (beta-lactamase class C family)
MLPDTDMPLLAGAGGVLSTAPDMLRWARLLLGGLNELVVDGTVPKEVREECMMPQVLLPKSSRADFGFGRVTYGFGWFQDEELGVRVSW